MLEEALGWDEELEQAAEPISPVAGLQQPKHLAQDGGGRGFEGGIEGLEGTLHCRIQRAGILREKSIVGGESGPAMGCHHPPQSTCPPSRVAPRLCQVLGTPMLETLPSSGRLQTFLGWKTGEELGVEHTKHGTAGGHKHSRVQFPALGCGLRSLR